MKPADRAIRKLGLSSLLGAGLAMAVLPVGSAGAQGLPSVPPVGPGQCVANCDLPSLPTLPPAPVAPVPVAPTTIAPTTIAPTTIAPSDSPRLTRVPSFEPREFELRQFELRRIEDFKSTLRTIEGQRKLRRRPKLDDPAARRENVLNFLNRSASKAAEIGLYDAVEENYRLALKLAEGDAQLSERFKALLAEKYDEVAASEAPDSAFIEILARTFARLEGETPSAIKRQSVLSQVQPPKTRAARFTGNWNDIEKQLVNDSLRGLKDGDLRNWIATKAELNRFKANNFGPLTANGSTLRLKDGFFQEQPARRENLIAFEAGKVFWNSMKDRRLADGSTLESWFIRYSGRHGSVIADMKVAKHKGDNFSGLGDIDTPSQFGYMFRALALQLTRPAGRGTKQEWDSVVNEFRNRINPLLRGN